MCRVLSLSITMAVAIIRALVQPYLFLFGDFTRGKQFLSQV